VLLRAAGPHEYHNGWWFDLHRDAQLRQASLYASVALVALLAWWVGG
jgi:hypothetical protein